MELSLSVGQSSRMSCLLNRPILFLLALRTISIEGALRKLVAAGELKKEGKGKNTCYFRLN